jgi:hypothetical protein
MDYKSDLVSPITFLCQEGHAGKSGYIFLDRAEGVVEVPGNLVSLLSREEQAHGILQSGIPWEMLPQEMGCSSGMTCWRRLRYWQRRGIWKKLLHALLQRVGQEEGIDWEHSCVDSQSFRAVFAGSSPAKTPRIGPK